MRRLLATLKAELAVMLWPFVFFAACFNALALTVALMSPVHDFSLMAHGVAFMGALIVAKAVLLVDHLPLVNRYPEHPLIYNTVWKASLYIAVTVALRLAERLIGAAMDDDGFTAGLAKAFSALEWQRILAVQLWLAILIVVYTTAREVFRVLGPDRVRAMFFDPPALATLERRRRPSGL